MTGLEALETVQYVSAKGQRFAVLRIEDWETLIEWLETVEDLQRIDEAFAELEEAGGDREKAGWRRWDELTPELE